MKTINTGETITLRRPDGQIIEGHINIVGDFISHSQTDLEFTD